MKKISSILGILVFFGISQTVSAADCYPYMPEKVSIQGRVSMETLPVEGGQPETYFFMNLLAPVCAAPTEKDRMNKAVSEISKIQLRFREEAPAMNQKLQSYMNSEIKCSGSLFSWHMPQHHTPVLMLTKECDAVIPAKTPSPEAG